MKVVWLCHFANQEMKEYFHAPRLNEFAPWISRLIALFKNDNALELHVVSPNVYTNKDCSFIKDGITFHFYKHIPIPSNNLFLKKVHSVLGIDYRTNLFWIKHKIVNIVTHVNPDIIHLHGAENPYYSAGILPLFCQYPVITTIQGFVRHTSAIDKATKLRIRIEEEIIRRCKHFGTRTAEMNKEVSGINQDAKFYFHNYPLTKPEFIKDETVNSEFDIIYFARICKDKGIEDLLKAVYLVKKEKPDASLHIIGAVGNSYKRYLLHMIKELNIENNVKFLGFLETQQDVYKHCMKARICVLPTYQDIIPGTIIESMLMKLPVIAYAVGGIPDLNIRKETVVLVEKKNISQLAEKILFLLNDNQKYNILAKNAYDFAKEKFNNKHVKEDILKAYYQIMQIGKP